jgi:hypothetical protein
MAFIVLLCVAVVVLFAFHGSIFKSTSGQGAPVSLPPQKPIVPPPPPKPLLVAPPANDALWMLNLDEATIPDSTAAGRVHGQDFIVNRADIRGDTMMLRAGMQGTLDFAITINFNGARAEALVARTINVSTNVETGVRVALYWGNDVNSGRISFKRGYALRLDFGVIMNNHLPGKIYLCTPDAERSYLAGTFDAEIHKYRPNRLR